MTVSETSTPESDKPECVAPLVRRSWPRRIARWAGRIFLLLTLFGVLGWSFLAIYFAGLHGLPPRRILAGLFGLTAIVVWLWIRPRRRAVFTCFGLFALVLLWFFSLKPSNDRDWAEDVAALGTAQIDGNQLIVHNVRNFDYRTETDYTPRWEDRTYDLSTLRTVDCMLVYWGSKAIAHAMVSFGFDDGRYLAVSIEARREKSQSYSAVQSFFRQFELIYIFSDERDVIRLRTNYRHEDVYLYRSTLSPVQARDLLRSYVERANSLAREPEFYNALTSNCANNILENAREGNIATQMSWRVVLSGYAAQQLYDNHRIDTSMPFDVLEAKSHINERANQLNQDPDFSQKIRVGLPMPVPWAGPVEPDTTAAASRHS